MFRSLNAEIVSIAQIERDPAMLPRITEFVHNTFPIVADPDQITRADFEIFSIYLVDKDGVVQTYIPGVKESRPRLDIILTELAKLEGVAPPDFDTVDERVVVQRGGEAPEAPAPIPAEPADLLNIRWMWSHNRIWPNDRFKLAFVLNVPERYHVYGPNESKMTPFRVELDLPDGIELRRPIAYPKSRTMTDPVLNVPLTMYEDVIPMPVVQLVAAKDLEPQDLTITARVHFQACNDAVCLPPTVKEIALPLSVVSRGTRRKTVAGSGLW